jgi:hypothetical protein
MATTRTLAVDAAGNAYVCAYGQVLAANSDFIVHKYDSAGGLVWARSFDGGATDIAYALAADEAGAVYVVGRDYVGSGASHGLVVKWDAQGNLVWSREVQGDTTTSSSWATGVAVAEGRVYVSGTAQNRLTGRDFTVWALDAGTGNDVWTRYVTQSNSGSYSEVATDVVWADGALVAAGYVYGALTGYDGVVVRLDAASGAVSWDRRVSAGGLNEVLTRVTAGNGLVAATGYCYTNASNPDMLTVVYSAAGVLSWSQTFAGPGGGSDQATDIALTPDGNVLVCGFASTQLASDMALLRYSSAGELLWSRFCDGGATPDRGYAVAVDGLGCAVMCGTAGGAGGSPTAAMALKYSASGDQLWSFSYRPPASAGANQFGNVRLLGSSVFVAGSLHWGFPNYLDPTVVRLVESPDVAVERVIAPAGQSAKGASVVVSCEVRNRGSVAATFECRLSVSDGFSDAASVTLPAFGSDTVVFGAWTPTMSGNWGVRCSAAAVRDYDRSNDVASVIVNVAGPSTDVGVRRVCEPAGDIHYEAAVFPSFALHNFGTEPADAWAFAFIYRNGDRVYADSLHLAAVAADGYDTVVRFAGWVATVPGFHVLRCSVRVPGDADPTSDTASLRFGVINTPVGEWHQETDVPAQPSGAAVAAGGGLASDDRTLYALKGNKTYEVFAFDVGARTWSLLPPLPEGPDRRPVHKGSAVAADGLGCVYVLKGNRTYEFYRYDPAVGWSQLAGLPPGLKNRPAKYGVGLAHAVVNDTGYLYALRGSAGSEFHRYNTFRDSWESLPSAPAGTSGRAKYKDGSGLTAAGDSIIFCVKGGLNEVFRFDAPAGTWREDQLDLPASGSAGARKKVKAGAGVAWADGKLAMTRGGGTCEFWRLDAADSVWREYLPVPLGGARRRVKDGGGLAFVGGEYFVLKGGKCSELWCFAVGSGDGPASTLPVVAQCEATQLVVVPSVLSGTGHVTALVACSDRASVVYVVDVVGRIRSRTVLAPGSGTVEVEAAALEPGQYFVQMGCAGRLGRARFVKVE